MPVRKGTVRYTMCLTETEREQFPLLAQRGTWPALNQGREKSLSITPVSLACLLSLLKKKKIPQKLSSSKRKTCHPAASCRRRNIDLVITAWRAKMDLLMCDHEMLSKVNVGNKCLPRLQSVFTPRCM